MANTGYQISPTVRQHFTSGPNSGSVVTSSFDIDLTVAPFSASLNNEDYFYRAYDPIDCEPGFENCRTPLLNSIITGSQRGRFAINYVTQSSSNIPLDITASISNDLNFGTSEIFSASIDSIIPITTSFVSGTVYFKAFTSCSGPDPSPDSSPLSFTYDVIPPLTPVGNVDIIFKNNLSSAMEIQIRSLRGNINYKIDAGNTITYDYSSLTKSEDLTITIKGGARSSYGNFIQRTTEGIEKETYTTSGGFLNPTSNTDNSSTFTPDKGLTFNVKQLVLPQSGNTTTTTFTLLTNTPPPPPITPDPEPDPGPGPAPTSTPYVKTIFGSSPYSTQTLACASTGVNYREKTYFSRNGYLYNSRADALDDTKAIFPNSQNYILTSPTVYLIVNQNGFIQNRGGCILPTVSIETTRGSYSDQESACARNKTSLTTFSYKDNKLIGTSLSGRYPLESTGRGGRNIILSAGRIIGYETCGTELTTVYYGTTGWSNSTYPLLTPENINPKELNIVCSDSLRAYSLSPSGIVYYHIDSEYPYVPVGLGDRWYKTSVGDFVNFDSGRIIDTTSPC